MEIMITGPTEITIAGDIKTVGDYLEIKKAIKELTDGGIDSISVKIPTSPSINSALIGFFLRIIHEDKVNLALYVGNDKLLNLFDVMNLTKIFNVKRI
jgi:hypothetical protein